MILCDKVKQIVTGIIKLFDMIVFSEANPNSVICL